MKTLGKLLFVGLIFSLLALPVVAVNAQDSALTKTATITEAELNALYVVSNPIRRSVTDVNFDIQDGQVVFSATITAPRRDSWAIVATYTAVVAEGRIDWTLQSLTVNGNPATDAQKADFSLAHPFWQYYVDRFIYPYFTVTGIDLGNDAITVTYTRS